MPATNSPSESVLIDSTLPDTTLVPEASQNSIDSARSGMEINVLTPTDNSLVDILADLDDSDANITASIDHLQAITADTPAVSSLSSETFGESVVIETTRPDTLVLEVSQNHGDSDSSDINILTPTDNFLVNVLADLDDSDSGSERISICIDREPVYERTNSSNANIAPTITRNLNDTSITINDPSKRITGYFVGDTTIFNLSNRVISESELSLLGKGLGFCPTPYQVNEYYLAEDFKEFSRKLRNKWHFRNEEPSIDPEYPHFRNNSGWELPSPQDHMS